MPSLFLTDSERDRLSSFPDTIPDNDMIAYFTLSDNDKEQIPKTAAAYNRLGFALQICALRYMGFCPEKFEGAPSAVTEYLAKQLDIEPAGLANYGKRMHTRADHYQAVQAYLGYRKAAPDDLKYFADWLADRALEHDAPTLLLQLACDKLRHDKIIRPGITVLERMVAIARVAASQRTFAILQPLLSDDLQQALDKLLVPDLDTGRTLLGWLRKRETSNTAPSILEALRKLEHTRGYGIDTWDLTGINPNRVKLLAGLGRRSTNQILQRMAPEKRYPVLLIFLNQTAIDITDEIVEMFDRCFMETYARARRNLDDFRKANSRSTNEKVVILGKLCRLLTDPNNATSPDKLYETVYKLFPLAKLEAIAQECNDVARPLDDSFFDLWASRYGYFRMFSRQLIAVFDFRSNQKNNPVIEGLAVLKQLNEQEKRSVPADAPAGFVSKQWEQYVLDDDGRINRHYWEMCLLWELRNSLRSGDVWVPNSRRYADPETYLISHTQWPSLKQEVCQQLELPDSSNEWLQKQGAELKALLAHADKKFLGHNGAVCIENGHLSLAKDDADELPESVIRLQELIRTRLPKVDLTELLIEVDQWTGFTKQFEHAAGSQTRSKDMLVHLYASIHAQSCNFGLSQMAEISGISYDRLSWTTNWYIREDTLKAATTKLVNFQYRQPLSKCWGGGGLSSSDGQRLPVAVESKKAVALPRYFGYGKGITFYTWTSDQFSQYGTKVVPSTVRDATYVLDEILDNQTELDIVEHTTDTAGYTEIVFALFDLLGYKFSPRLKDLPDQTLYRIDRDTKYRTIDSLLSRPINAKLIMDYYDDLLRLAGSLKLGWVTASLIISKLQAHPRQNSLTKALAEYGCLVKTRFILQYLMDEGIRKNVHRQLNKGEALHAVRRFLLFANEGKIRRSQDDAQTNQAGCLNVATNAIVAWNTVYMQAVIDQLKTEGYDVQEDDLKHISPARHEHINPYGRYDFNVETVLAMKGLRPLRR